ncbi:MAG: permease [Actinomycetota bacterium]
MRTEPTGDHGSEASEPEPRWSSFFGHLTGDFTMMAKYLVIGAAAAATLQTFIPSSFIDPVANTPVLSMLALMGLAAALSLCFQSDAFVAASLVQFAPASQLAFLVFGPMVDAKLLVLYRGTFSRGFVRNLVVTVTTVTLAGTLWVEILLG